MKSILAFTLFAVASNAWAGCRIWSANECKQNYPDQQYGVYLDGRDATGLCHSWDQALGRSTDLNNQGLCHHHRGECRPALAASACADFPSQQYGVYVDDYDATNQCHSWQQALARISELRRAGVCR